ncbi:MAG: UDP-N-acetylmuramoyl-tripeptide--D-alanyl-D-alanine ligase [Alphaproteobacteria bacterium]|nr:UDP-N-acetylmuramoyl-tripeptide--D-alanyl-D-alanine ligase [Alphaproteobacteria bacterium]
MAAPPLWTAIDVAGAVGAPVAGEWTATGVSIDSRSLRPGDLFVALRGPNFDGHAFIADAVAKGAVAAVVDRVPDGMSCDVPLIEVGDTLVALTALGRASVERATARIAAITGSVGKTGTKEALRHCLERQAPTVANIGNLNNHIGVPLSLARMPADATYGVFEIGMNSPGEIGALSRLVRPNVAVITTVAAVHVAAFDSIHDVAEEKSAIFEGIRPDGVAILNRENAFFPYLNDVARSHGVRTVIGFGAHPEADARLVDCTVEPTSTAVSAIIDGSAICYRIGLSGRHHALNSLAVLAAAKAIGADIGAAAVALGDLTACIGRGRRHIVPVAGGAVTVIDDSYNASPVSMRAALSTLNATQPGAGGRRIAALGDMLELGSDSARLHVALAESLTENEVDLVFAAGTEMAHLYGSLPQAMKGGYAKDSSALVDDLVSSLAGGDVIIVKGSHGSRMDIVVDALTALASPGARIANGR